MRSTAHTFKIPLPVWTAFKKLRQKGGPFAAYQSDSAAVTGFIVYATTFPKEHLLTAGIAALSLPDQDTIHNFILHCVEKGIDIRSLLPKPATAEALLALARQPR